jgi:hypothetical protein
MGSFAIQTMEWMGVCEYSKDLEALRPLVILQDEMYAHIFYKYLLWTVLQSNPARHENNRLKDVVTLCHRLLK